MDCIKTLLCLMLTLSNAETLQYLRLQVRVFAAVPSRGMADKAGQALSKLVKWPKILLLGDSQTQGGYSEEGCWVSMVSDHFQRKCDVVNRGLEGYNVRWLKELLPALIDEDLAYECQAVTLFLGSNDANTPDRNPEHHVPLQEFEDSLIWIGQKLMELGVDAEKIIFIGPPPVDEELWRESLIKDGRPGEHGMRNEMLNDYSAACGNAAKCIGAGFIDLYSDMMQHEDWKKYVNVDGLHLAKAGSQLLARLLILKLESITQKCKQIFPGYQEVDNSCHELSFHSYV